MALKDRLGESLRSLEPLIETGGPAYVLGLHALARELMLDQLPDAPSGAELPSLLDAFVEWLRRRGHGSDDLRVVARIGREHAAAREAQRQSSPLDIEEERAATHDFLRFCALCGVSPELLTPLRRRRDAWSSRQPGIQPGSPLAETRAEIVYAQGDVQKLLSQTERWTRDRQALAELEAEIPRAPAERRPELQGRAEEARQRLAGYRDLDLYVQHVRRFSLYTRTRMDYERSVTELTPEQSEAVDAMRPGYDFLVRGGAGTGKTIVLLHALRTYLRSRQSELPLGPGSPVLFLTYTTTLVKYDRYVAEILRETGAADCIMTVDSFFQARLADRGLAERVDYTIIPRIAQRLNSTTFLENQELAAELEDFLFGGLVTRREYVEEMIPRRGMRQPLTMSQREAVWEIREKAVAEMEHDGVLSRNFSRLKLIEGLDRAGGTPKRPVLELAFVDESQDLCAADLRALKLMTSRGLVMAGDAGQTIYGVSSPYRRAGIDISGRSRVLRVSFRNTRQILEAADAYRGLSGIEDDDGMGVTAFREGPVPELYTAATREELARLLLRKAVLFMESLGYDPESITVLAPTRNDVAMLGDLFGHAGYRHANIRDEDFSFAEQNTVRLSTLHSSKGLDFPVVLLYLPELPPRGDVEEKAGLARARNLIYVAMTRAMDNLNVFTLEGAHEGQGEEPVQDLVRVMRALARR